MVSTLHVTQVKQLQGKIFEVMRHAQNNPCVYVSVNKTQKSTQQHLEEENIQTEKIFFIDCVTQEKTNEDVLHVQPQNLELLSVAIQEFIKEIKGEKYLLIDALSTLLIYNDENKVVRFVKEITEYGSQNDVTIYAFSPETKGEELLDKIFNFFDHVEQ